MSVLNDAWSLLTRLGEAQILLPAMLAALLWLALLARTPRTAWWWLAGTAAVVHALRHAGRCLGDTEGEAVRLGHHSIHRRAERRDIERPAQLEVMRRVEHRIAGVEALRVPQPLLRLGQRQAERRRAAVSHAP